MRNIIERIALAGLIASIYIRYLPARLRNRNSKKGNRVEGVLSDRGLR